MLSATMDTHKLAAWLQSSLLWTGWQPFGMSPGTKLLQSFFFFFHILNAYRLSNPSCLTALDTKGVEANVTAV